MKRRNDILIVDDDADMVEVIEMVLRAAGYATRAARNGLEALEQVGDAMPALILLDILMPVMNGWKFADELRARYGDSVPIVVVTAAEHAHSRAEAIDAASVLEKPFEMPDLLRIVAQHVSAEG